MKCFIIAGEKIVDGEGSFKESGAILKQAHKLNLKVVSLEIVNLAKRWEDKLSPNEFKSGASAMAAVEKARSLLKARRADLVVIKGSDYLKTGYDKTARENYMKLYNDKYTPLEGYDQLVPMFLKANKFSEEEYFYLRDELFKNYLKTWKGKLPDERWFSPLTKYFRGVDCANPNIDYSGQIILSSEKSANALNIPTKKRIQIIGNSFTKLSIDGMESLPKVATYQHLKKTIDKAIKEAKVNFKKEYLSGKALLDAYTCYPVVPMGLILKLDLARNASDMKELLSRHEVTVTGGLNLARAAWNLTSLNSIIVMRDKLIKNKKYKIGLVHGNGSLGNQQGITVLKAAQNT